MKALALLSLVAGLICVKDAIRFYPMRDEDDSLYLFPLALGLFLLCVSGTAWCVVEGERYLLSGYTWSNRS